MKASTHTHTLRYTICSLNPFGDKKEKNDNNSRQFRETDYSVSAECNRGNIASVVCRFFELKISGHDANGLPKWNRTQMGLNVVYHVFYIDVLYYLLCFALPLVSLVFMNWKLILGYRAARRRRSRIMTTVPTGSQTADADTPRGSARTRLRTGERESTLTLVMIMIIIVFIACQLPARLVQLFYGYKYSDCRQVGLSYYIHHQRHEATGD